jgi:uncharacterized membrane protein YeaQ/YmgE (transglycosylase-associated protein family)
VGDRAVASTCSEVWPGTLRGYPEPMDFSEILGAIVLGIIAGYLARLIVPGRQDIGFLMTVLLGIGGALIGYFLFTELLGIGDDEKFDLGGLLGAIVGAVILLLIYVKLFDRPATPAAATAGEGGRRATARDRAGRGGRRRR